MPGNAGRRGGDQNSNYSIAATQACADASSADVVVVNTCTVTASADLQARQAIHTIHRENRAARIVVTGCYAQRAPEELALLNGVAWVVGNSHKPEIPRLIEDMVAEISPVSPARPEGGFVPLSSLAVERISFNRAPAKILSGNMLEHRELLVAPVEVGEAGHTQPGAERLRMDATAGARFVCSSPQVRGRSRSAAPGPKRGQRKFASCRVAGRGKSCSGGIDLGNYGRDLLPAGGQATCFAASWMKRRLSAYASARSSRWM